MLQNLTDRAKLCIFFILVGLAVFILGDLTGHNAITEAGSGVAGLAFFCWLLGDFETWKDEEKDNSSHSE